MKGQGQYTESDYLAAMYLHECPRRIYAILGIAMLLLALLSSLFRPFDVVTAMLLGGSASLVGYYFIYLPHRCKKNFRQYKAMSEPHTVELLDEGLHFRGLRSEGLIPWSHIIRWRRNDKVILLYPMSSLFYLVPQHFFEDRADFDAFVTQLELHLGNPV